MRRALGLAAVCTSLVGAPALAAPARQPPSCDPIVEPDTLAAHAGHAWREGAPIVLRGDLTACNYYQDEAPAGLSLAVRKDPLKRDFDNARETHAAELERAAGMPGEAFYFHHRATPPFADAWGLVVHADGRTVQLEGVPEAGDAARAKQIARDIVGRALARLPGS